MTLPSLGIGGTPQETPTPRVPSSSRIGDKPSGHGAPGSSEDFSQEDPAPFTWRTERTSDMKTTALCLALSSLIGLAVTPAVRADDIRSDRRDIYQDSRDLRHDRWQAVHEGRELRQDRREVRSDVRSGNRCELRRDLRSEHRDARELSAIRNDERRDAADIRHDRRDLRHDRFERWNR